MNSTDSPNPMRELREWLSKSLIRLRSERNFQGGFHVDVAGDIAAEVDNRHSLEIAALNAAISELRHEVIELRKDAERYRYLRARRHHDEQISTAAGWVHVARARELGGDVIYEDFCDGVVDAAMQQETKP